MIGLDQERYGFAAEPKHGPQVYGQDVIEGFVRHLRSGFGVADTCIVVENVQPSEAGYGGLHNLPRRVLAGNIKAKGPDVRRREMKFRLWSVYRQHARAL